MSESEERLIELFREYVAARGEYDRCIAETAYDAGYFCWDSRQRMDQAGAEFFAAVKGYIDERISLVRPERASEQAERA